MTINTTYQDIPITYDESANLWRFELRGRDRSADSLAAAKAAIDKPVPEAKAKPFENIPAWYLGYSDGLKRVNVTGIAEVRNGREHEVWIKDANGRRSKERVAYQIYPSNMTNDAIVADIIGKRKEIAALNKAVEGLRLQLEPLKLEIPD